MQFDVVGDNGSTGVCKALIVDRPAFAHNGVGLNWLLVDRRAFTVTPRCG